MQRENGSEIMLSETTKKYTKNYISAIPVLLNLKNENINMVIKIANRSVISIHYAEVFIKIVYHPDAPSLFAHKEKEMCQNGHFDAFSLRID